MKRFFNILFGVIITLSAVTQTSAQDLPSACVGSKVSYWVKGFNGFSDFTWQVTDPDGNIVPPANYTLIGRGDTIEIIWDETFIGGIYTFTVVETTDYNCTGVPYEQDVVLNSPEIFIPFNTLPEIYEVCFGNTTNLDPGSGYLDYLWQDGSTNQLYITSEAGTYRVRLVDTDQSCSYDTTNLIVNPLPIFSLGEDTVLFASQTLTLDVSEPNFDFYEWTKYNYDNSAWETIPFSIAESVLVEGSNGKQWISVLVTDDNGCENSDSILISAENYNDLKIPAAFTPNGDGKNDKWIYPKRNDEGQELWPFLDDVTVRVYNRYGKMVWESKGPFKPWDGKDLGGRELPMDSYHYIIRINIGKKTYLYKGSVTIVR